MAAVNGDGRLQRRCRVDVDGASDGDGAAAADRPWPSSTASRRRSGSSTSPPTSCPTPSRPPGRRRGDERRGVVERHRARLHAERRGFAGERGDRRGRSIGAATTSPRRRGQPGGEAEGDGERRNRRRRRRRKGEPRRGRSAGRRRSRDRAGRGRAGRAEQRAGRRVGLPRHARRGLRLPPREGLPAEPRRLLHPGQARPPVRAAQGRPHHRRQPTGRPQREEPGAARGAHGQRWRPRGGQAATPVRGPHRALPRREPAPRGSDRSDAT